MIDKKNFFIEIGDIIHKLNHSVSSIVIRIELLKSKRKALIEQDSSLADFVEKVEKDTKDAMMAIGEIRRLFTTNDSLEAITLAQAIDDALFQTNIPKSIKATTELDKNLPKVRATSKLRNVFLNLFENAKKAMPDGGVINIIARENHTKMVVDVIDTGCGISPSLAQSLFSNELFLDSESGHGLGLWWSKSYLQSIGGDLELVSSELGKGSTFRITLDILR